jgi:hypothetical protein
VKEVRGISATSNPVAPSRTQFVFVIVTIERPSLLQSDTPEVLYCNITRKLEVDVRNPVA